MRRLRKFMALSGDEQRLYVRTACWLIGVKAGLLLVGFDRLRRFMDWRDRAYTKDVYPGEMTKIIEAIQRISTFLTPLRINCLPQALVGHRLIRKKGLLVQLKMGVLKDPGGDRLYAHAWLEYQGCVVLGDFRDLNRFTAFPSLETAGR